MLMDGRLVKRFTKWPLQKLWEAKVRRKLARQREEEARRRRSGNGRGGRRRY
jgi:hypothetical protein